MRYQLRVNTRHEKETVHRSILTGIITVYILYSQMKTVQEINSLNLHTNMHASLIPLYMV